MALKATFDASLCRYKNERRIIKAREILLSDHAPITGVALTLGFSSHSHFKDMFCIMTGTATSLFRQNWL
ncbi:MAG: helix-turn-helix domain-containing protein [Pseudomonadota bacterium]|jgi:AraC family transcriptional regulator